jgi:hypothetical protein
MQVVHGRPMKRCLLRPRSPAVVLGRISQKMPSTTQSLPVVVPYVMYQRGDAKDSVVE